MSDIPDITIGLLDPGAYFWTVDIVERIDTHLSHVFLAGERVIKIKQAVDYGFVDFRSHESRRIACDEECTLNRRLTRDVYLGTVPITRDADGYHVAGDGEPVEWATLMRRLPADRMLDVLLSHGEVPGDLGGRLAEILTNFHRQIAPRCDPPTATELDSSVSVVLENLDELQPFVGSVLDPDQFSIIEEVMSGFVAQQRETFTQRISDGWIREGHGDLRAEHICVEPDGQVQLFDCVEFSQVIRCADVASDLAFLLMDLERLGGRPLADELLDGYRAAAFYLPDKLIRFYKAHRALVRAKVACLSLRGSTADHYLQTVSSAADYLNIASAATLATAPAFFVMTGLSGTGKSTVAQALARATGASVISSDSTRKDLAGVKGSAAANWGEGIYSERWTELTYAQMLEQAVRLVLSGRPVILDATFLDPTWRTLVTRVANTHEVPAIFIESACAPDVVARRIAARTAAASSVSDATMDTYREQLRATEHAPFETPTGAIRLIVDTSSDGPVQLGGVIKTLNQLGILAAGLSPVPEARLTRSLPG